MLKLRDMRNGQERGSDNGSIKALLNRARALESREFQVYRLRVSYGEYVLELWTEHPVDNQLQAKHLFSVEGVKRKHLKALPELFKPVPKHPSRRTPVALLEIPLEEILTEPMGEGVSEPEPLTALPPSIEIPFEPKIALTMLAEEKDKQIAPLLELLTAPEPVPLLPEHIEESSSEKVPEQAELKYDPPKKQEEVQEPMAAVEVKVETPRPRGREPGLRTLRTLRQLRNESS